MDPRDLRSIREPYMINDYRFIYQFIWGDLELESDILTRYEYLAIS